MGMSMPRSISELAQMLAERDGISYEEELAAINFVAAEMETAFCNGDLTLAEDILRVELGLEPSYLDLFIY
jgi:hypothetical protein